jgi:WD40-like Beta Propeller Repeat
MAGTRMRYALMSAGVLVLMFGVAATGAVEARTLSDWSVPVSLGPNVNSASFDSGGAISRNGLSLYVSSNRPGGFGGFDLYVSHRHGHAWGRAVNLGSTINTPSLEAVPSR